MRTIMGPLAALLLLILPLYACAPVGAPAPTTSGDAAQDTAPASTESAAPQDSESTPQESNETATEDTSTEEPADTDEADSPGTNFVLLISDEKNDIEDFAELWVTITGIGLVLGEQEGIVEEDIEDISVNLVEVTGDDAVAAWEGYIPEGDYTKVFLYIDEVTGVLADPVEGEDPVIKLPSGKLQLDLRVELDDPAEGEEQEPVTFVYDITVHKAGNSGQYILSPQATESGQGKTYQLLEHTEERIMKGKPDFTGQRDTTGKPEWAGEPGGRGLVDEEGTEEEV